jgi:uncharacterized phage-associated protein
MPYDARLISNSFLTLADADSAYIFPMQLQKLIYLAHGWSLALRGKPLISEDVEAWKYGPVVPVVYHEFKEFRASAITRPARIGGTPETIDPEAQELIRAVWDRYKSFSGIQLSAMTHESGYAWDTATKAQGLNCVIPDALIYDEFIRRKNQSN